MTLVKFNDGRKDVMNPGLNDVFESLFNDSFFSDRMISRVPAVNITETDGDYRIELAAPGLSKSDFKINLDRNVLHISAERRDENRDENKRYSKMEYCYESFVRSFALPDSADGARIDAGYHDGVLNVTVAKKEEAKRAPREISVK